MNRLPAFTLETTQASLIGYDELTGTTHLVIYCPGAPLSGEGSYEVTVG